MCIKINSKTALLVSLSFLISACQEHKSENLPHESNDQPVSNNVQLQATNQSSVAVKPNISESKPRVLTPISNAEFEESMRKKNESLDMSNAILARSESTHNIKNDVNMDSDIYMATKTDKNTNLTELDAVEQAIQAAAPALDDNTDD